MSTKLAVSIAIRILILSLISVTVTLTLAANPKPFRLRHGRKAKDFLNQVKSVCVNFSIRKSKFGFSGLYFGCRHKQIPEQSASVIFNHHYNRSLVNSKV